MDGTDVQNKERTLDPTNRMKAKSFFYCPGGLYMVFVIFTITKRRCSAEFAKHNPALLCHSDHEIKIKPRLFIVDSVRTVKSWRTAQKKAYLSHLNFHATEIKNIGKCCASFANLSQF